MPQKRDKRPFTRPQPSPSCLCQLVESTGTVDSRQMPNDPACLARGVIRLYMSSPFRPQVDHRFGGEVDVLPLHCGVRHRLGYGFFSFLPT